MNTSAFAAAAALLLVAACSSTDIATPSPASATQDPAFNSATNSNPTSTWEIPLDDALLSVRSDRKFPDAGGTYSVYAAGVCSFASTMFTTGSGDDTFSFNYPKGGKCGRTWTVTYPDGFTETLAYGGGLQVLEKIGGFTIPIGSQALRHFRFAATTGSSGNPVASRCSQGLVFGPNGNNPAPGSDSVMVTRVDARTWDVHSQPAPNDHAYCIDNGQLYEMQVAFRIIASEGLP
jgi:hypothetical protein